MFCFCFGHERKERLHGVQWKKSTKRVAIIVGDWKGTGVDFIFFFLGG